jgi:hypothetical protein
MHFPTEKNIIYWMRHFKILKILYYI